MSTHQTATVRALAPATLHWQERGSCRGNWDSFHADTDSTDDPKPWEWQALETCWSCPVVAPCLRDALQWPEKDQHGVAGGMTASQRRAALRRRGDRPQHPAVTNVVDLSDLPPDVDFRIVQGLLDGHRLPHAGWPEKRWAAIALHRGGWPSRQTAGFLGVAERTVARWVAQPEAKETAA